MHEQNPKGTKQTNPPPKNAPDEVAGADKGKPQTPESPRGGAPGKELPGSNLRRGATKGRLPRQRSHQQRNTKGKPYGKEPPGRNLRRGATKGRLPGPRKPPGKEPPGRNRRRGVTKGRRPRPRSRHRRAAKGKQPGQRNCQNIKDNPSRRDRQGQEAKISEGETSSGPGRIDGSRDDLEGLLPNPHHGQGTTGTATKRETTLRRPNDEHPANSAGTLKTQ